MDYRVIRSRRRTISAQIKDGQLTVRAPLRASDREIADFVRRHGAWIETHLTRAQAQQAAAQSAGILTEEELRQLTARARQTFGERVACYAPLVGVDYGRITVRRQRSRWGSCSARGNLSFNCLLLLAPPEVLDAVVVHELCHRRVMSHSRAFYDLVLRVYPDYRKWDRWLKENGPALMLRLPPREGETAE